MQREKAVDNIILNVQKAFGTSRTGSIYLWTKP
jgi:hypothetical protein